MSWQGNLLEPGADVHCLAISALMERNQPLRTRRWRSEPFIWTAFGESTERLSALTQTKASGPNETSVFSGLSSCWKWISSVLCLLTPTPLSLLPFSVLPSLQPVLQLFWVIFLKVFNGVSHPLPLHIHAGNRLWTAAATIYSLFEEQVCWFYFLFFFLAS